MTLFYRCYNLLLKLTFICNINNNMKSHKTEERTDLGVWRCKDCEKFHVKAGKVLLTFTREEFSDFVNKTWDCFYGQEFDLSLTN